MPPEHGQHALLPVQRRRAPSLPTAPQERTANSSPTPSVNAVMVNVSYEALTATLSAAVQQAVRSALTTASTSVGNPQRKDIVAQVPDVPVNLVSRVVETELSDLTNAGQIPLNTEGTGPRPTTEFRSVAISLAASQFKNQGQDLGPGIHRPGLSVVDSSQ